MEELNSKVVRVAVVEKNSCALASLHHQGEVEWSRGVEGVQLDVGVCSCQLNSRQVLAAFARVAWVAFAGVCRWGGGKAGAVPAGGSLAWGSLLVSRHLHTGRRLTKYSGIARWAKARWRSYGRVAAARSM